VIGKSSILGEKTSWTFNDLKEVLAGMPEGTNSFGDMTKENFLNMILMYCGREFVNIDTGKCTFDSQNFIDMLEFANTFPEEIDYDYSDDTEWEKYWQDYQSQYRENKTLLMSAYISSLRDMNYQINGYFGEDVSFVGFPTETGNGSVLTNSSTAFSISSKSANKDAAWQFVRYYLTDEYQNKLEWGLPVSQAALDVKAKEATQKNFYMDGDEKVEYDDYFDINGESVVLEPLSQEQVDEIVQFIQTVKVINYYNQDIYNIVSEEANSFFAGQKSAQDVAKVIQSRAQIYVDENR
jgi:ABC-type glycerol-3-phosphate transport system substrate-binding protein